MRKSSQVGLFISGAFFFAAGGSYFWPDGRVAGSEARSEFRGAFHEASIPPGMMPLFAPMHDMPEMAARRVMAQGQLPVKVAGLQKKWQNAPVQTVLRDLFAKAHVDYVIHPAVHSRVTLTLSDTNFSSALGRILQHASPPLSCRYEEGTFIIEQTAEKTPHTAVSSAVGQSHDPDVAARGPANFVPALPSQRK